jgi:hypothetical protein
MFSQITFNDCGFQLYPLAHVMFAVLLWTQYCVILCFRSSATKRFQTHGLASAACLSHSM